MMLIIQYNDLNIPARIMYNFNEKIPGESAFMSNYERSI